ncbi:MAG: T9SS type A sorting domain-containing protein [Bacteroidetes bacterium]|nr:T9SS type A sorting domain-containing protein [Bacteroidota bacterium]MBL0095964.1 T9SS type A sorting domain-containing protein [Bacteroidota bacterium]
MCQNDATEKTGSIKGLLLYPNPANDYIRIKLTGTDKIQDIKISDLAGRIVYNVQQADLINTSALSSGIYFVKVRDEGIYYNGSFIIQR